MQQVHEDDSKASSPEASHEGNETNSEDGGENALLLEHMNNESSSSCTSLEAYDQEEDDDHGLADDEMEENSASLQNITPNRVQNNIKENNGSQESTHEECKFPNNPHQTIEDASNAGGKQDSDVAQASITEKLLHQFYLETINEMNIFDPFANDLVYETTMSPNQHKASKLVQVDIASHTNHTPCEDLNENAINSKQQLLSIKRELEHEISLIESQLFDLNETEAFLTSALNRLTAENRINNALKDLETNNLEDLTELSKIVEIEVEKKEASEQNKIISNLPENDGDYSFTNSSIAYNILQLQHLIDTSSKKLEQVQCHHNQLIQNKRRRMIEKAHLRELNNQSLNYEKKVNSDTKKIEDKYCHDLKKEQDESYQLESTEKMLQFKLQFVTNEDGQQLMETMQKVMSMLKGREELPDGNYISVSRAINYYSQLKEAAEKNVFTVEYFKKFLREHKEFGVFACNFEDYYSPSSKTMSAGPCTIMPNSTNTAGIRQDNNGDSISSEVLEKPSTKYILDPTEILYNTREEMPKFDGDAESKTPLNKRSSGSNMESQSRVNGGTRVNRSLSLSKSSIAVPSTPTAQNVSSQSISSMTNAPSFQSTTSSTKGYVHDVIRRSMNALSKVQASKKSKH
ncbi:hypothetical protein FDP41_000062 [Naegleria fowleri]|uniref:Uncharacterized protein n=1 Tax=Naegleria fowleri TaxID=5763 RepID=A0A6A5C3P0_NAEFO|nr:uncharacterized protein FDP41_000062 [Naegleria fowleri]KAF0985023.1 hypothetical protein FDP41_000062 [Naegleria fowleri]